MNRRHTITVANGRVVTVGAYVNAVKRAIALPEVEFNTGLTTWWPTTGREIARQFREGVHDRINEAIPNKCMDRCFQWPEVELN